MSAAGKTPPGTDAAPRGAAVPPANSAPATEVLAPLALAGLAPGPTAAPDPEAAGALAADAAARERALDTVASFIVEAPAGAGKTELLTQRFLALLARVAEPEEIVAITFTNKAAAEMRRRVLASLERAAGGERPAQPHAARNFDLACAALANAATRGWAILEQPARLRVLTVDALCATLARQMPVLSRIGGSPAVSDDPEALYADGARLAVEALEGSDPAHADCVAAALLHVDNDAGRLQRLLATMLARRDQWLRHGLPQDLAVDNARVLHALAGGDIARAAAALGAATQRQLIAHAAYALEHAPERLAALAGWDAPLAADWDALPRWQALAVWLLTGSGDWRKRLDKNQGFPAGPAHAEAKRALQALLDGLPAAAAEALAALRGWPPADAAGADAAVVAAFAGLLQRAAAALWVIFGERGEVDFIAVAEAAQRALGDADEPSELALRLDYRIAHLLVDEFQDTSPAQVALLKRLTAGWSAGDGRTLFCVGDPMQSIYRFRKADVGLFIDTLARGIGGLPLERLRLARNNRSAPPLVDWINDKLKSVFADEDEPLRGAIRYRPFVATRPMLPGAGVEVHALLCAAEASEEAAAQAEARRLLALIDAERAAAAAAATADPAQRREIAVLVRARRHLEALVALLRRERPQLAFQAVEVEPLGGRQWVRDLVILTRALLHPADRVHWLALLRSPLCGLTLADLHALAADERAASVWRLVGDDARVAKLSADGRARLAALRAAIGPALANRGRLPPARLVEGVWLALGGAGTLPHAAALADCNAYFALLAERLAQGRFVPDELEAATAKLYAAADPAADGSLQLMTIHKAKGLEFDTVIVPGLHREVGNGDRPLLLWEEAQLADGRRTAVAVLPRRDADTDVPSVYGVLARLERTREQGESARLLYVAATRARRVLHLLGAVWQERDGEGVVAPNARTLLGLLWPRVGDAWAARAVDVEADGAGDARAEFVPHLQRQRVPGGPACLRADAAALAAVAGIAPPVVAFAVVSAATDGGDDSVAPAGDRVATRAGDGGVTVLPGAGRREALLGTLAHRYLELIVNDGPDAWPLERVHDARPAMRTWLAAQGLSATVAGKTADEATAMLATTLASPAARALLAAPGGGAEIALASGAGAAAQLHVIDRSFVTDGVRHVVDFKTDLVKSQDDAGFRAAAERHRAQLVRYAALYAAEGRPVRCAIVFVRYGRVVEVAVG